MTISFLTNAGIADVVTSSNNGVQINIGSATFNSTLLVDTSQATMQGLTTFPNPVYTAPQSSITYQIIDENNVMFRVFLGPTIGNFNIGAFSLNLADGTMFTVTALDALEAKIANSGGNNIGNSRYFEVILNVTNATSVVNLTLLSPDSTALPEVGTELNLPNPNAAPYPVYYVHSWQAYNQQPALASRYNNGWYFYPCYGVGNSIEFDPGVAVGNPVYYDTTSYTYKLASATDDTKAPVGLRGQNNFLVQSGQLYVDNTDPFKAGSNYYVNPTNPSGPLTTTPNNAHVGYAKEANTLVVFNLPLLNFNAATSASVYASGHDAYYELVRTDATTNNKHTRFRATTINSVPTTALSFVDDTGATVTDVIQIGRSGLTSPYINLVTSQLQVSQGSVLIGPDSTGNRSIFFANNAGSVVGTVRLNNNGGLDVLNANGTTMMTVDASGDLQVNGNFGTSTGSISTTTGTVSGKSLVVGTGGITSVGAITSQQQVAGVSLATEPDANGNCAFYFATAGSTGAYATMYYSTSNNQLVLVPNSNGTYPITISNTGNILTPGNLNGNIVTGSILEASFGAYNSGDNNRGVILADYYNSKGVAGYMRWPNGFILQWMGVGLPGNGVASSYALPTTFPNLQLACVASFGAAYPPNSGDCGAQPNGSGAVTAINMSTAGGSNGVFVFSIGY